MMAARPTRTYTRSRILGLCRDLGAKAHHRSTKAELVGDLTLASVESMALARKGRGLGYHVCWTRGEITVRQWSSPRCGLLDRPGRAGKLGTLGSHRSMALARRIEATQRVVEI
jgi:hypothetical protein